MTITDEKRQHLERIKQALPWINWDDPKNVRFWRSLIDATTETSLRRQTLSEVRHEEMRSFWSSGEVESTFLDRLL